jgi:UDP-glucose 4-epimerase
MNTQSSSKPTRWLITGGCGFIGTSLIKNLVSEGGHTIRVLDNLSVGTRQDLARVCDFSEKPSSLVYLVVGDITDYETCLNCCQGIDIIVHLAANTGVGPSVEDPRKDMDSNVIGTFNMLEAARHNNLKRFIFASSGAPVGECEPPIHEELAPHPVSPYGASKLAGEGYCSSYYRTFGIETIALRFGNVYGPGSTHKNSVVAKFIKQAIKGETLEIYGDGYQTRDFIYIDDLISAIRRSATVGGIGGQVFQIATNHESTINEMVEQLLAILKESGIRDVKFQYTAPRAGDVKRNFSDTTKSKKVLGWTNNVNLQEGLKKTVEWFLNKDV